MSVPVRPYHPRVHVEREGHVVTVTLDSPKVKNACTGDMWVALGATFRDIAYSGARVVLLTGAGDDFCAGADLSGDGGGGFGTMVDGMRVLSDVVLAIHDCPVPVVARIDGACMGAGLGLALAADLAWCTDRARFSVIYAKRGISLDFGTSWLLRQRIGVHKAKELAYTAKTIDGTEAAAIGLVNAALTPDELDGVVREVVDTIAAGPPVALSLTKRQLDQAATSSLAQALELEAMGQSVNVHTEDLREALTAFTERRPPNFKGR